MNQQQFQDVLKQVPNFTNKQSSVLSHRAEFNFVRILTKQKF